MPRIQQIIYTRCTDAQRELEFNRWYSHSHLPDLSAAAGFVHARRFVNALPNPGAAKYMAVYEFESDSPARVLRDLTTLALQAFEQGRHIDCIQGLPAGNTPIGAQWLEIDPAGLEPLTEHHYADAPLITKTAMKALIAMLNKRLDKTNDIAALLASGDGKDGNWLRRIARRLGIIKDR